LRVISAFLLIFSFGGIGFGQTGEAPSAAELTVYLSRNTLTPEQYVIAKFKDHDVVLLGEQHRLKENVDLIARLIPICHRNGICALATEFARREDQSLLDSLVRGKAWNEELGRRILFQWSVFWGYREYLDIYKAAWQTNQNPPQGRKPFRVIAMNDSPDWSFIRTDADRDSAQIMQKVLKGCDERLWAETVAQAVAAGEKVLWYSGIHHAFCTYQQPDLRDTTTVRYHAPRAGNYLRRQLGDRVMTVFLHAPWSSYAGYDSDPVLPADGMIDSLMESLGPTAYPAGFDLAGTPFGKLPGRTAVYSRGYAKFTIDRFCDGWIYHGPISKYHGVTAIPDFVNEGNLKTARSQSPNPHFRTASATEFNSAIASDGTQDWLIRPFRKK
jgi:hypothetical protein